MPAQPDCFFLLYLGRKRSGEQSIPFLFSNLQDPEMLIGANLNNKGLLIGENDAHYLEKALCY